MDSFAAELSDDFERQSFEFFHKIIEEARENGEIRNFWSDTEGLIHGKGPPYHLPSPQYSASSDAGRNAIFN